MSVITLTKDQEKALKIAVERYKNKEPYTVIAGYAGTGKTFLVKHIIDKLKIKKSDVVYIAYTGKASLVLKNNGCKNAMTAHRLLYDVVETDTGMITFVPKNKLEKPYKVVVLDEASMLPESIWKLLLSHHIYVLALGDHGQLPPIEGNSTILATPHAVLEEIIRQELESPIIKLSADIRMGKPLEYTDVDDRCRIVSINDVDSATWCNANQILCGKNTTRNYINRNMRAILYGCKDSTPINGDKVICLQNQWQEIGSKGDPLINGTIGHIKNLSVTNGVLYSPQMCATFISENGNRYNELQMDYKIFTESQPTVNRANWKNYPRFARAYEFDYGYCITVHKAQGSEWDSIIVINEQLGNNDFYKKWLYTAVTRASKQLVLIK